LKDNISLLHLLS